MYPRRISRSVLHTPANRTWTRASPSPGSGIGASTGAGILAVACPKDKVMFGDAIKTAGLEGQLQVKDIAELVAEAVSAERLVEVA